MTNNRFSGSRLPKLGLSKLGYVFLNLKDDIFPKLNNSSKVKAFVALTLTLLIWGFIPVLVRLVEQDISPIALVFHRRWIASLVLGIGFAIRFAAARLSMRQGESNPNGEKSDVTDSAITSALILPEARSSDSYQTILALILAATVFALADIAFYTSLSQTTVANSALLHNFTPIFIALIGFVLLGKRFDAQFIIGILIAICGSAILGWDDLAYKIDQLQGDGLALVSALFCAIYFLLLKRVKAISALTTTFYCCLIGSVVTGTTLLFTPVDSIYPTSALGWIGSAALSCTLILSTALIAYSMKHLAPEFVSATLLIDPVLTSVIAWVVLAERIDGYTLISFPLILLGVYLATTSPAAAEETG